MKIIDVPLVILMLMVIGGLTPANAQESAFSFFNADDISLCPATMAQTAPPDFSAPPCRKASVTDIDPQGMLIWVRTTIPLTRNTGPNGEPLSLYISGKMSSEVYLNGQFVGRSGQPGADRASETVGRMDAELFPPQDLFQLGENEVIFRASSHHGFLTLYQPFHMLAIAPTGFVSPVWSPRVGPAVITLGLFLLGALYFGVMALMGPSRTRFITLSAICVFAGAQLLSELLRALVAYSYPIHDLRLLAIAGFSTAFGLGVAFHILSTFLPAKTHPSAIHLTAALGLVTILVMIGVKGFDFKALAGMTLPLLASLLGVAWWGYKKRERALGYFTALLIFILCIVIFRGFFLDTIFFMLVALLVLFLFVEQARILARESRERLNERDRANRLELALAEAEQRNDASFVTLKSAGKIERVATHDIILCKGASGYSEIVLSGGRTLLHSASLNEMETILPATFVRVHRSYLINAAYVKSLNRDASGTGTLLLTQGAQIPVSRRIMPKVRQALG